MFEAEKRKFPFIILVSHLYLMIDVSILRIMCLDTLLRLLFDTYNVSLTRFRSSEILPVAAAFQPSFHSHFVKLQLFYTALSSIYSTITLIINNMAITTSGTHYKERIGKNKKVNRQNKVKLFITLFL